LPEFENIYNNSKYQEMFNEDSDNRDSKMARLKMTLNSYCFHLMLPNGFVYDFVACFSN